MAWSVPLTAVSNAVLTAAQWNASVRDNLLESAPAKATTTGRLIVSSGTNTVAERAIQTARVIASQGLSSLTYANLATTGPQVASLTTGANALAFASAACTQNTNSAFALFSIAVSGATTIACTDAESFQFQPSTAATASARGTYCRHFDGTLTPGANTFTMQYRASAGSAFFESRALTMIAL